MPQCQQDTSDRAKKEKKNGRREKDVREKEGGLSLLQCLNDKIGGNLGMETSRFLLVLVSGGGCLVSAIWSGGGNMWFKIMGKADEPWYGKLENCHRSILGLKQKNNSAGWKLFLLDSGNMPISTALYKGRRNLKSLRGPSQTSTDLLWVEQYNIRLRYILLYQHYTWRGGGRELSLVLKRSKTDSHCWLKLPCSICGLQY